MKINTPNLIGTLCMSFLSFNAFAQEMDSVSKYNYRQAFDSHRLLGVGTPTRSASGKPGFPSDAEERQRDEAYENSADAHETKNAARSART